MSKPSVTDVRSFWEANPLHNCVTTETEGTKEFFEQQRELCNTVLFAKKIDPRIFPKEMNREHVLDMGSGPGLWTVELALNGLKKITAIDLTDRGLEITRKRCKHYGVEAHTQRENAENLSFEDKTFSHVHSFGVIHHTPDTPACVREAHRVLKDGGTATISVYYKNFILRHWSSLKYVAKFLYNLGARMRGRGRERIYTMNNIDEVVRCYDGIENPIGKSYTRQEYCEMLEPYFDIKEIYLHYFPVQSLPFKLPFWLHRWLELKFGFMIVANLKKKTPPNEGHLRTN